MSKEKFKSAPHYFLSSYFYSLSNSLNSLTSPNPFHTSTPLSSSNSPTTSPPPHFPSHTLLSLIRLIPPPILFLTSPFPTFYFPPFSYSQYLPCFSYLPSIFIPPFLTPSQYFHFLTSPFSSLHFSSLLLVP